MSLPTFPFSTSPVIALVLICVKAVKGEENLPQAGFEVSHVGDVVGWGKLKKKKA